MLRIVAALMLTVFFATACNTMDGLVTDVDHGVSKLKGDDKNR
jgi:predicted small secreted protein